MLTAALPAAARAAATLNPPGLTALHGALATGARGHLPAAALLAAKQAVPILNMGGITALLGGILAIVLLSVAIRFGVYAHRGNLPAVLGGIVVLLAALFVWGVAKGNLNNLGNSIAHLLTNL